MSKTQPARGTRDFLPADVRKRNYVIGIIKEVYESYGFEPLETPAVENLETLTGKYGEEGNQLMFKILKRGEKLQEELARGNIKSEKDLSDLALRYDLTVPLARVVANYKNELPKFFKRYQIQPVWRADRPARGRFREFYQCDVDAIGSKSMVVEAELISAVCEILERLGFEDFVIRLNHREVLNGLLRASGIPDNKYVDSLVSIDKLDKIGEEGVITDLQTKGIDKDKAIKLLELFHWKGEAQTSFEKKFREAAFYGIGKEEVEGAFKSGIDKEQEKGEEELKEIIKLLRSLNVSEKIKIDFSLARGLSYYTGAIFEIVLTDGDFAGSIGGGGRYDGLIGMFGKEEIPACGFSLGLERILVVMEEREMFPPELETNSADVLVTVMNEETAAESLKLANELRKENLRVLVYPEDDKLGKQFKYADTIGAKYVCVLGDTELAENKVTVKNLKTGEQETVGRALLGNFIAQKSASNLTGE